VVITTQKKKSALPVKRHFHTLIQYEDKKKEIFELNKAPRILQKKTSRMMIRSY
jgi:hypothetical protein